MADPERVERYTNDSYGREKELADLQKEQVFVGEQRIGPEANKRLREIRERIQKLLEEMREK